MSIDNLTSFLVENILLEEQAEDFVVIYPGRFQPFHINHYDVYEKLVKEFGKDKVWIATSNKTEKDKSPFTFQEKKRIMTKGFGVPANRIVQVKNTYAPSEILNKFDDKKTAAIFIVGQKDANRLGGRYFTPYKKGVPMAGYKERGYVKLGPPQRVKGLSGTKVRNVFRYGSDDEKEKFFKELYPRYDKGIFNLISNKLHEEITIDDIDQFIIGGSLQDLLNEISSTASAGARSTVDDGPNYHWPSFEAYQSVSQERAAQIGWSVIGYGLNGGKVGDTTFPIYPNGPVDAVSFLPAGVMGKTTATNQVDVIDTEGWDRWFSHTTRTAALVGYELVNSKEERIRREAEREASARHANADIEFENNLNTLNENKNNRFLKVYHSLIDESETIDDEMKEYLKIKKGDSNKKIKEKIKRAYTSHSKFREAFDKILNSRNGIISDDKIVYNGKFYEDDRSTIRTCVEFTLKELGIGAEKCPRIHLTDDREDIETTAHYNIQTHEIKVYSKGRGLADILRSIVHEIVHHLQNLEERIYGVERIDLENEAHAKAGEIITKFKDVVKKNIYINESVKTNTCDIIMENPDVLDAASLDGKHYKLFWHTGKTAAFGYYKNKMYVGPTGQTHSSIMPDGNFVTREQYDLPGRVWIDEKIIAFWEFPSKSKFKKVLRDIEEASKEQKAPRIKFDNSWQIEILVKDGNLDSRYVPKNKDWGWVDNDGTYSRAGFNEPLKKIGGGYQTILIPINNYSGSEEQKGKGQSHVKSPLMKKKKIVPVGLGSKKKIPGSKKGEAPIKTRYRVGRFSENKDMIPGGLSDGMTLADIAKKHNMTVDQLKGQFKKGITVELEHTYSKKVAAEIALDHIFEDPKYYDKLEKIEKKNHDGVNRKKLNEGGAYGHMSHPFDDMDLTFGDLKQMVQDLLQGNVKTVYEKTDGQNLMFSWKNGKAMFARNKGHIRNYGVNAMDVNGVKKMFSGRGNIEEAFSEAAKDIHRAVSKLSKAQQEKIFAEGKHWMSFEVIYPKTTNVIPYGHNLLIFHGILVYDESGNAIGEIKEYQRVLAGMIKQVNAHIQNTFNIRGQFAVKIPRDQNFEQNQTKFLNKINALQREFKLKDSDTLSLYHQKWWENFVDTNHTLPERERMGLVKRWAFGDKSFRINDISNVDVRVWAKDVDKTKHADQIKKNMLPFETLFLDLGAKILQNLDTFIAASPDKKVRAIRGDVLKAINDLRKSSDLKTLNFLERHLKRLEAIGGLDAIVPSEGIVFVYKGNTYKLTGAFAPINQILGYYRFGR